MENNAINFNELNTSEIIEHAIYVNNNAFNNIKELLEFLKNR